MTPNQEASAAISEQSYDDEQPTACTSSISSPLPTLPRVIDRNLTLCSDTTPFPSPSPPPVPSPSPTLSDSPPERIPRPPNSFMLFRSDFLKRDVIPASVEKRQQTLSRVAGEVWNLMPLEEKKKWHEKSAEALRIHSLRHPNYKFSPARRGAARKSKAKAAEEEGTTNKDRIRELRETYLHMRGPAVPSARRRRGKQQASASEDERIGSASESSTDSPMRAKAMEHSVSEPREAELPMMFPRPTYPHLLLDHLYSQNDKGDFDQCSARRDEESNFGDVLPPVPRLPTLPVDTFPVESTIQPVPVISTPVRPIARFPLPGISRYGREFHY